MSLSRAACADIGSERQLIEQLKKWGIRKYRRRQASKTTPDVSLADPKDVSQASVSLIDSANTGITNFDLAQLFPKVDVSAHTELQTDDFMQWEGLNCFVDPNFSFALDGTYTGHTRRYSPDPFLASGFDTFGIDCNRGSVSKMSGGDLANHEQSYGACLSEDAVLEGTVKDTASAFQVKASMSASRAGRYGERPRPQVAFL